MKTDVRDTSLQAHRENKYIYNTRRQQVYKTIQDNGPLSISEIARRLHLGVNSITGRLDELRKEELVMDAGKRRCSITGRTVHIWRCLNNKQLELL